MKLLQEIYHNDINLENSKKLIKYEIRKSARAVLLNDNNEIAVLYVSKDNYYKLPGGGIEKNEEIIEALKREVDEEVGTDLEVIDEIGMIMEYREKFKQLNISYNYICKTSKKLRLPKFTEYELVHGFQINWFEIEEARERISNCKCNKYVAKFISIRDTKILDEAINKLNNS